MKQSNNIDSKSRTTEDTLFKEFLRRELPEAPKDEWFVRKTMNRLPPQSVRIFSTPEIICFIAIILLLICWGGMLYTSMMSSQAWTYSDTLNCLVFISGWGILAWQIVIKIIRAY